jgi:hypothetical protein
MQIKNGIAMSIPSAAMLLRRQISSVQVQKSNESLFVTNGHNRSRARIDAIEDDHEWTWLMRQIINSPLDLATSYAPEHHIRGIIHIVWEEVICRSCNERDEAAPARNRLWARLNSRLCRA